jgi:aldehyde dehydrogenase (NAD+)
MAAMTPEAVQSVFLDGVPKRLLIGGEWVAAASGETFETVNPSNGEVIARLAKGDQADIGRGVRAARDAFQGPWRSFTPAHRQRALLDLADLVEKHGDELQRLDSVDMGGPITRLSSVASGSARFLRYCSALAMQIEGETVQTEYGDAMHAFTLREPVGVVGAIVPWNGPISNALWKIGPVLATGCTLVLKPAEEASLSALRIGELIQDLDLPPGVVNIVTGFGETAGAALSSHQDVDKVAFTGSTVTGQKIIQAAAGNLKRVSLELGGKGPDVIFADADLDVAIEGAAMAVFSNSGQVCFAGTRVFVERSVYETVVDGIARIAEGLKVGHGLDPETVIGPLVSKTQLDRVTEYLDHGKQEGARAVAGGQRATNGELANGYFVPPTVFADVKDEMRIAREEIFGPVASLLPFDEVDEVIARANATSYGLGGGVWTRDITKAHRLARSISAGMVWVNTYGAFDPAMPFGGFKMSGWGRELSKHSIDEYTNLKAIWINSQ